MHLVPIERAGSRMIEPDKVCEAIGALHDEGDVRAWAHRFSLLGDLTRMRLLLCIKAAGPISVSDLTAATGLQGDTVSQTLRFLRANQIVTAERDGRVIRYCLADPVIGEILDQTGQLVSPPAVTPVAKRNGRRAAAGAVTTPNVSGEPHPGRRRLREIHPG